MKERKQKRRALLSSIVSLLLCCSLLLGSTFAWFTAAISSDNNTIWSGNLDMKLSFKPYGSEYETWTEVEETTAIFNDNSYEPGHVNAIWFEVENTGTLALNFNLNLKVLNEVPGINIKDERFKLSDFLLVKAGLCGSDYKSHEETYSSREEILNIIDSAAIKLSSNNHISLNADSADKDEEIVVEAGNKAYMCVVIYMPKSAANDANHDGDYIPSISLGITALASQAVSESDSFGMDYDKDAGYGDEDDYEEENGGNNEDDNGKPEVGPGEEPEIGSGDEPEDRPSEEEGTVAEVIEIGTPEDLFVFAEDVNVNGNDYSGKIVRLTADLDLKHAEWTPIGINTMFKGSFDGNGHMISNLFIDSEDSAGLFNELGGTVKNLTIDDAIIRGNSNVGVIAGSAEDAMIKNVIVKNTYVAGYDNIDELIGSGTGEVVGTDTTENVMTFDLDDCAVITNSDELFAFAEDVNINKNSYLGKSVYLLTDIDLENRDWTPIGQTGSTMFQGTFDGLNHEIHNLLIDASGNEEAETNPYYCNAMFGWTESKVVIKNLTIDGAKVTGAYHYSAVIIGTLTGDVQNCVVKNAVVETTHSPTLNKGITGMELPGWLERLAEALNLADSGYCGDKAGAIVGYINDGSVDEVTISNCTITGGRDVGQIAGAAKESQIKNYVVDNKTVKAKINNACGWAVILPDWFKNCDGGIIGNKLD